MQHTFSAKTRLAIVITIFFWSSAFVGIRAGLLGYSPGGLALLRFITASICLFLICRYKRPRPNFQAYDLLIMFVNGIIGIGIYHITLNLGEVVVPSGIASFIISQSPVITAVFAILFLSERISLYGFFGMFVSLAGILLITLGKNNEFKFYYGIGYILIASTTGAIFSILQKPLLKKYHAIDVTTYTIWFGTLSLFIFLPNLMHDIHQTSLSATLSVIYLGIFPGAIAYLTWSYVLAAMPAARAVSFLYFMPVIATLIGWVWLKEMPSLIEFIGGLIALSGVWIVNHSYKFQKVKVIDSTIAAEKV